MIGERHGQPVGVGSPSPGQTGLASTLEEPKRAPPVVRWPPLRSWIRPGGSCSAPGGTTTVHHRSSACASVASSTRNTVISSPPPSQKFAGEKTTSRTIGEFAARMRSAIPVPGPAHAATRRLRTLAAASSLPNRHIRTPQDGARAEVATIIACSARRPDSESDVAFRQPGSSGRDRPRARPTPSQWENVPAPLGQGTVGRQMARLREQVRFDQHGRFCVTRSPAG